MLGLSLFLIIAIVITISVIFDFYFGNVNASIENRSENSETAVPPNFRKETVVSGMEYPTGLAFLGPDDILVIEQDKGTVQRVVQGVILEQPLIDVNVANEREKYGHQEERGLLGIVVAKNKVEGTENFSSPLYVFLYFTEAEGGDGGEPIGNRLYRYELVNNKLVNPNLLLDLPVGEDNPSHNGGPLAIGPDGNVYLVVGNLLGPGLTEEVEDSLDQNIQNGKDPDGSGGILRVTQDGEVVNGTGILGNEHPLDMYYAYGIRNSFGMNFDPLSGNLWFTENGGMYDEINLALPGFNSGWDKVVGNAEHNINFDAHNELVDFDGRGKYRDPKFSWRGGTVPTAIIFFHSDRLGREYENDILVGSASGNIYNFDLTEDRNQLDLKGMLSDKVADSFEEGDKIVFASNLGVITDLEVGPDGNLYGTSYDKEGSIFMIGPQEINVDID